MSSFSQRYPYVLNALVIAVTIVFVAVALVVGRATAAEPIELREGDIAPITFVASREVEVVDEIATNQARERAVNNTPAVYTIDPTRKTSVKGDLARFFDAIKDAAFDESAIPEPDPTTTTTTTTTTVPPDEEGEPGEETTTTTTTTEPPTTTTTLPRVDLETQIAEVQEKYATLDDEVVVLVSLYNDDLDRRAEEETEVFPLVEREVADLVDAQMDAGIRQGEAFNVGNALVQNPPRIFLPGLDAEQADAVRQAVARLVAETLVDNEFEDQEATAAAQQVNAETVEPVIRTFFAEETIVEQGEPVSAVELDAIEQLGLLVPEETTSRLAIAALGALAVLLAAFFLWRIAPGLWSEPKHFALLGVLLVLAAGVSRIPELIVPDESPELAFVLPAVMFGYIAAILYDPRTAVLLSVPVATFTAISTQDAALTMFAAAATITPVGFVSSVSSRRELRVAVGLSAVVLAPLAGVVAWLFIGFDSAPLAALFGFVGGVVAGLVAQGLLSFLENLFRVTTTVTLLDLTDRNHPALRLLEEKAPGTFNHSILVGTLAGKAARAIEADPLLAQAAAYYHDLGKTEHPQYFIENQFGFFNPHDELDPAESAKLIRQHVSDGLRLARQYRIPEDVANGIRMHHGTGLMRYFYHKALEADPGVDPAAFRHGGAKPRRKEMAILMVSDAVEGAARALAQQEDPTADGLRKLVDSVVGEKLEDGQLDESALTFGDLTRVKTALVEALIGYYHTRIPYPGFPTGPGEAPPALGDGGGPDL